MKSKKKLIFVSIISIIAIFILAVATSYALFNMNITKNRNFKVAVGNLELSLNDDNQGNTFTNGKIIVSNMVPMKDSTGMEQDGYSFTLTNNGTIDATYSIYIDDIVLADLPEGTTGRLDNNLVRINLTNTTTNTTNTYTLSEITDRLLETGILNVGESNSYILRMWLDYTSGNDAQSKYYATKIRVDSVQKNSITASKFCKLIDGTYLEVSSKYECDLGDGVERNFYLLADNNDSVKLIMEHNITEGTTTPTMTWNDAMNYFESGDGVSLKTAWTNVTDIDLPSAQDIANAVGNTAWDVSTAATDDWFYFDSNNETYGQTQVANASNLSNYRWLYNYTVKCAQYGCESSTGLNDPEAPGYWTKDNYASVIAWDVNREGSLYYAPIPNDQENGVRPVVTVLKSSIME